MVGTGMYRICRIREDWQTAHNGAAPGRRRTRGTARRGTGMYRLAPSEVERMHRIRHDPKYQRHGTPEKWPPGRRRYRAGNGRRLGFLPPPRHSALVILHSPAGRPSSSCFPGTARRAPTDWPYVCVPFSTHHLSFFTHPQGAPPARVSRARHAVPLRIGRASA